MERISGALQSPPLKNRLSDTYLSPCQRRVLRACCRYSPDVRITSENRPKYCTVDILYRSMKNENEKSLSTVYSNDDLRVIRSDRN